MLPVPRREDYPASWAADVTEAASVLVEVIEDLGHHDLGDGWEIMTDDPVAEIDRLRRRLNDVSDAVTLARRWLRRIDRRAVAAARRRGQGS